MYNYFIGYSPILIIGFLITSQYILDSIVDCDKNASFARDPYNDLLQSLYSWVLHSPM